MYISFNRDIVFSNALTRFQAIFTPIMSEQASFRTKNPATWLQLRQNRQLMRQKGKENLAWQYISHFVTDVEMLLLCFENYDNTAQQYFDQYIPLIPSIQLYEFNIKVSQAKITRSCLGRCGFSPLQTTIFQDAFIQQHEEKIGQGFLLFLLVNNVKVHVNIKQYNYPEEYNAIFDIINQIKEPIIKQREYAYQQVFLEDNDPQKLKFQQEISEDITYARELKNLLRFDTMAFQRNPQQQLRIISLMEQIAFSFPSQTTFGWLLSYLDKINKFDDKILQFDHNLILNLIPNAELQEYYKNNLQSHINTINHYQITEQFPLPLTSQNISSMPKRLRQYFIDQAKHLLFDHQKLTVYEPNCNINKVKSVGMLLQYIYHNKRKIKEDEELYYAQLIHYMRDFYILDQMHIIVHLNSMHLINLNSNDHIYKQLNSIFEDVQTLLKLTTSETGKQVYLFEFECLENLLSAGMLFINALIEREKKYQFVIDKIYKVLTADKQMIQEQQELFYGYVNNVMTNENRYHILLLLQKLLEVFLKINNQVGKKQKIDSEVYDLLTSSQFLKFYDTPNSVKVISIEEIHHLFDDMQNLGSGSGATRQAEELQVDVVKAQITQKAPQFILSQVEQKWMKNDKISVPGIDKFYPKANRYESEKDRKDVAPTNLTQLQWVRKEIGECML